MALILMIKCTKKWESVWAITEIQGSIFGRENYFWLGYSGKSPW